VILANISLLLYAVMLALVLYSVGTKGFIKKIGFKKLDGHTILSAGFYLVVMLILSAVIGAIFYAAGQQEDLQKVSQTIKSTNLPDVLIVLLLGSIVEELFFRGYLMRKTNILFSTFVFGYFHIIYGSFSEVVGAFFLGLVLAYSFSRSKNLYVPTIAHIAYNLITVAVVVGAV